VPKSKRNDAGWLHWPHCGDLHQNANKSHIHRNTRILKTLTQPTSGRRDRPVIAQGAKRVPQEFDAEGMFCASSADVVSTIVRFTSISWPITKGSNPSAISITPIAVSTVSNKPHRKSPGTQFRSIHSVTCFPIAYVPVKLKFSKKICLHFFAGCYCLRDLVLSLLSKGQIYLCPLTCSSIRLYHRRRLIMLAIRNSRVNYEKYTHRFCNEGRDTQMALEHHIRSSEPEKCSSCAGQFTTYLMAMFNY